MTKEPKKTGRPPKITPEIENKIFQLLSEGESENSICRKYAGMPSWTCWTDYKRSRYDAKDTVFAAKYAQARDDMFECWETRIIERSMDESRDQMPDGKGGFKSDNTATQRDRLITDNMKWIMARRASKKYGDKVQTELTGANGGPVQYEKLVDRPTKETPEQWQERVSNQLTKRALNLPN